MRLAFVTPEYVTEAGFSGGLANYLGRVTVALQNLGHDVHVFTKSDQFGDLQFEGVTVHRVVPLWDRRMILDHADPWVPRALYTPYQDLKAAWCLYRQWSREHQRQPFDVVQLANVLAVGLFFRWVRHRGKVMRLSSYRPAWDTVGGTPLNLGVRSRWWLEKKSIQGIPHVYAPTEFVARLTKENYGVPAVDVIETPFFQEQPQEDPSEYQRLCSDGPYLLFFGRMTKMKGVHRLAEALPRLLGTFPDMKAVFIGNDYLAPDGGSMHAYIRACAAEFASRVVIAPAMRHDRLYPIVKNAAVVVLPSIIDNLPNTCLEAMSFGKTVVATSGSCFEQLIEHGVSGLLCRPDDRDALADAVEQAWRLTPGQKSAMGDKAVARIRELSPEVAIPRLVRYYEQIAGGTR